MEMNTILEIDNFRIDPFRFEVIVNGEKKLLTKTPFKILYFLAQSPGRIYSRYQIVDAVRGKNHAVTDRAVDVHIMNIRRAIGKDKIKTFHRVGYGFKEA